MNVQEVKRILRLQEWTLQINECKQSGQSVRQWCYEHGIKAKTFYNRMKVVREGMLELAETVSAGLTTPCAVGSSGVGGQLSDSEQKISSGKYKYAESPEKPIFAELQIPQAKQAAMTVRMGGYSIDIQNGADAMTVEQVLRLVAQL